MTEIPITIKTTKYVRFDGEFCGHRCYYLTNGNCARYKADRWNWHTHLRSETTDDGVYKIVRCKKCLKRFGDEK